MAASARRVVVWDPQQDWLKHGYTSADSRAALLSLLLDSNAPGAAATISYKGGVRDLEGFGFFCRAAFAWAKLEPATIVVEELSWVTHPGKAPTGWHELVTGGLKFGINLVSITQRPQESDKTALSQADVVRCFALERIADQRYMAGELGVDVDDLVNLAPLEYVEKNRRARIVSRGKLAF